MDNDILWRPVPGTEGKYEASHTGLIRRIGKTEPLTPGVTRHGHLRSSLYFARHLRTFSTITLVGLAWMGRPPQGYKFWYLDPSRPGDTSLANITVIQAPGSAHRANGVKFPSVPGPDERWPAARRCTVAASGPAATPWPLLRTAHSPAALASLATHSPRSGTHAHSPGPR